MSNLKPDMIGLDKGLNLQTAKIVAPKGSVLDTLNYEQVDFQGQKRIDGFTRYDGSLLAALDDYLVITVGNTSAYLVGDLIATNEGLLGILVSKNDAEALLYVATINEKVIPEVGESIFANREGSLVEEQQVTAVVKGVEAGDTPEEHYENLLAFNNVLRNRVESLPGPIAGLHWFRDRLHAIAGVTYMSLEGTTPQIYPGDELSAGGRTATVLDAFTLDNTRAVFLDAPTVSPWTTEGTVVTRDSITVGTVANGYEEFPVENEIASIWEARTEEQVLREDYPGPYDFGWKFIALGWKVLFENGISLYGSLPSINQNIEGIGTQGPTPISGASGSPRALSQSVSITNVRSQVNGWKSSQSPDNYNLTVNNLDTPDNAYIYADAYITWNGTTGVVSAPGASSNSVLVEYPATNTIEVVI